MKKKYNFYFEAYICLTETEKIINWAEQGWQFSECCPYHSLMATVYKNVEMEMNPIDAERYLTAVNAMGGDIRIAKYEEVKEA